MILDFEKSGGLVPVIIQDFASLQVLMLGYMNEEAFNKTRDEGKVYFFSRSKNRLWLKGETSGNVLYVKNIQKDCDSDALLILAKPTNVVCHTGSFSCFGSKNTKGFVYGLEQTIAQRIDEKTENSYTYQLVERGLNKVAQKVGEEAVELVIEAKDTDEYLFLNEAADLLYHYLILLKAKNYSLERVEQILLERSK